MDTTIEPGTKAEDRTAALEVLQSRRRQLEDASENARATVKRLENERGDMLFDRNEEGLKANAIALAVMRSTAEGIELQLAACDRRIAALASATVERDAVAEAS